MPGILAHVSRRHAPCGGLLHLAKNRLSAYIDKVRAGQTVLIFDRNRPVARLERVETAADADDRLTRLERAGLLRRGRAPLPLKMLRSPAPKPRRSVVQALLDERREGR